VIVYASELIGKGRQLHVHHYIKFTRQAEPLDGHQCYSVPAHCFFFWGGALHPEIDVYGLTPACYHYRLCCALKCNVILDDVSTDIPYAEHLRSLPGSLDVRERDKTTDMCDGANCGRDEPR